MQVLGEGFGNIIRDLPHAFVQAGAGAAVLYFGRNVAALNIPSAACDASKTTSLPLSRHWSRTRL